MVDARCNISVGEDEYMSELTAIEGVTGGRLGFYRFDAVLVCPPRLVGGTLDVRTTPFREDPNVGRLTLLLHSAV